MPHAPGSKSLESDMTMILKRSNHIPMFISMEMTKRAFMFFLTFSHQSDIGTTQLHITIVQ